MVDHCDFAEQVHLAGEDGAQRPDLVVRLAGGRSIVVDSKVPLDAHLDALATDDEEERQAHLRRHARQLRAHVDGLSAKAYWRSLPCTPEFVVLFVPTESSLAAALDADPTLLEHAAAHNVVVATPTTLIALLRTVGHAWRQESLARDAAEIHGLGRELHGRLATLGGHLGKLGRSLDAGVRAYNDTVGSLESRVLVTARRFSELSVTRAALEEVEQVDRRPRVPGAPELVDGAPGAEHEEHEEDEEDERDGPDTGARGDESDEADSRHGGAERTASPSGVHRLTG
jgi:DNA recombination protein RmuC